MARFSKQYYLDKAKEMIASETEHALRYTCLDLRCCIEALAYEKLLSYEKSRAPEKAFERWQPKSVIEAVLEYDPVAFQNVYLELWEEDEQGIPIKKTSSIQYKTITKDFINLHYSKLGSYLHTPSPAQQRKKKFINQDRLRKYLNDLIQELEIFVNNPPTPNFNLTIAFNCALCQYHNIINILRLEQEPIVICCNENCRAQHEHYKENNQHFFKLAVFNFECLECHHVTTFSRHKLRDGLKLTCENCKAQFKFEKKWGVSKIGQ